ncbi:uncharacterized protein Triagg1_1673 [Trichoderma aggressivum f. europaeum]|uniref:Uncharacterized protein n=1 Tax=Trichoderma aggressivum f. europaeum TaxID=173218 RepID=A0AAE1M2L2_9HYPO|nr:hypothetical protein Triagg1_1673 [Trichoderma aggressivum f. europaeum]
MLRIRGDILLYHQHRSGGHKVQPTFEPSSIKSAHLRLLIHEHAQASPSEAIECRVENFSTKEPMLNSSFIIVVAADTPGKIHRRTWFRYITYVVADPDFPLPLKRKSPTQAKTRHCLNQHRPPIRMFAGLGPERCE